MEIKARFIQAPYHAYLIVEKNDFLKVIEQGEEQLISDCSGIKSNMLYLEEDDDAITFIEVAKSKGYDVNYTACYQQDFPCPPKNYYVHSVFHVLYL